MDIGAIAGRLKQLTDKLAPVSRDLFNPIDESRQHRGFQSDTSEELYVTGRLKVFLEVENLPECDWDDDGQYLGGEIVFEGSVNGRVWFELCRLHKNGTYNLAAAAAAAAAHAIESEKPQIVTPERVIEPSYSQSATIVLHKVRARVSKLPEAAKAPVQVFVLGVNA